MYSPASKSWQGHSLSPIALLHKGSHLPQLQKFGCEQPPARLEERWVPGALQPAQQFLDTKFREETGHRKPTRFLVRARAWRAGYVPCKSQRLSKSLHPASQGQLPTSSLRHVREAAERSYLKVRMPHKPQGSPFVAYFLQRECGTGGLERWTLWYREDRIRLELLEIFV